MSPASPRPSRLRRPLLAAAALAFALAPAPVRAQELGMVGEFKLPGGAAVVTADDHAVRRVVIDTWIAAGSAHDFPGFPGVAAATARMLWNGGKASLLPGVKALGGDGVYEVDREFTHFQLRLPAAQLEAGLALAGKAFSAPDWDAMGTVPAPQAIAADLGKLSQDREAAAAEAFMAATYGPEYGHPTLGDPDTARRLGVGEVRAFFDRHYLPSRLRVVLAGDLDTGRAVGSVVRSYAAVLKRVAPGEAPPARNVGGVWTWRLQQPTVVAGLKGADVKAAREQAALEMVGHVAKARLEKAIGEPAGSASVGVRFVRFGGPSPLVLTVATPSSAAMGGEDAVRKVFEELRTAPVRLDEHARAQVAVANAAASASKDLNARARGLGFAATVAGDPHWLRTYPEIVRQVSRQDMLEAVQKYATPDAVRIMVVGP